MGINAFESIYLAYFRLSPALLVYATSVKTCINCGGTGPFGPNKNAKDGLKSNCRKCLAEKQRAYAAAHPEAWANWATANADHLKAKDAARYRADPEGEKARVRAYRDKNPEKARVWGQISKFRRYNLTPEDVNVLFTKQGGKCAICPVPLVPGRKGMVVDHDHETGLVRGLLCSLCNMMLGDLRETPAFFDRAIAYLLEGPVMGLSPQKRPPGVGYASNGTRAGNL